MSKKCFGRFEGTINCYERKKRRTGKPEFFKVYFHIKNHIRLMMKFEVTPHHLYNIPWSSDLPQTAIIAVRIINCRQGIMAEQPVFNGKDRAGSFGIL
jgi:hypothetical protein